MNLWPFLIRRQNRAPRFEIRSAGMRAHSGPQALPEKKQPDQADLLPGLAVFYAL